MEKLIGREQETQQMLVYLTSERSEFIVVLGRRRVGKTFLIRQVLGEHFSFYATAMLHASLNQQLVNFNFQLAKYGKLDTHPPTSWQEAFQQLSQLLETNQTKKKKVVFLDELPWFDTNRSGFVPALEHFWNSWASARDDVMLVTCGSAASWMLDNIINNHGGLHNRATGRIALEPFDLAATAAYLNYKNIKYSHHQILETYMVLGGIPFYLSALQKGKSAAQNINALCFSKDGLLFNEMDNLYAALFKHHEKYEAIVGALSKKAQGLTRAEIMKNARLSSGGGLSKYLSDLEASGFVRKYTPIDSKVRDSLYQLTDPFSLFYFKFMDGVKNPSPNHWQSMADKPTWRSWAGYAFERVCLKHIEQIRKSLGISGVSTKIGAWRSKRAQHGAQIDLIIDRADGVINLCEMKFSTSQFTITKKYDEELRNKAETYRHETKSKKAIHLVMITVEGLAENMYARHVQAEVTSQALFSHT